MTLYEIDEAIYDCVNDEGEFDENLFNQLQGMREQKLENVALGYKNLTAFAEAVKNEEKALAAKRKAAENKAKSLENFLADALNGEGIKTPKVNVTWKESKYLQVDDMSKIPEKFIKRPEPTVDKVRLTAEIKAGKEFDGVELKTRKYLVIK